MPNIAESALYHQPQSNWCALLDSTTLQLTLRSKAGDLAKVVLVSFPRYGGGKVTYPNREMQPILRDPQYDYYQITLYDIPIKRLAYYFLLHSKAGGAVCSFTEMGLGYLETQQANGTIYSYAFQLPYIHDIDIHHVPKWAVGAVAYQIFPDRFARQLAPNASPNSISSTTQSAAAQAAKAAGENPNNLPPDSLPAWGTPPTREIRIGGNLAGIAQKLPYLHELGIELLYMTPIFKARSNHKYDTTDYKQIDPDFGTNRDFRELVQQCHRLGIRIVLDAVFNHCGPDFAPFVDVLQNGAQSPYRDWFHILHYPLQSPEQLWAQLEQKAQAENSKRQQQAAQHSQSDAPRPEIETEGANAAEAQTWAMAMDPNGWTTLPYETFAFTPMMPKLNTQNPELKEYLLEVAEYWIREYDIDGWRLDVANEVDHHFWREFRQRVRAAKSDALIVGEIWHDSRPWLQGDQFDCVMNYPFQKISFDFFLNQSIDSHWARQLFNALLLRYSPQVNSLQWNMLDSHDTARLLHCCKQDTAMVKLLLGLMLAYIGIPIIYYGTELGLDGAEDPDCRRCMPWQPEEWNTDILSHVKTLIGLRQKYTVLRTGSLRWLEPQHSDLLAFERFDLRSLDFANAEPSRRFLFNRSEQPITLGDNCPAGCKGQTDLLSGQVFCGTLAAKSMAVL